MLMPNGWVTSYLHMCLFYSNKSKMVVGLLVNGCFSGYFHMNMGLSDFYGNIYGWFDVYRGNLDGMM